MAKNEAVGSLADGAERLERLIRGVKDRQFSEVRTAPEPKSLSNAFVESPQEVWSKKFMTAGIGPTEFKPVQMPSIPVAPMVSAQQPLKPTPKSLEPVLTLTEPAPPKPMAALAPKPLAAAAPRPAGELRPAAKGPIGASIAKPQRKRSWFGRLVRGD
jgi:hypothetical protein